MTHATLRRPAALLLAFATLIGVAAVTPRTVVTASPQIGSGAVAASAPETAPLPVTAPRVLAPAPAAQPGSVLPVHDHAAHDLAAHDDGAMATTAGAMPSGGACGVGMADVVTPSGTWCRHAAMDLAPPHTVRSAGPVTPKCYGNGVNGPRVRLIYAYSDRQPNRAATLVPRILNERAAVIEGNFRTTSREQGREMGVRFYAPGCKLSVTVVAVPHEIAFADTFEEQIGALADFMRQKGFKGADRIHHLWLDAPAARTKTPPCGVALQSAFRFAPAAGDNPTPANLNNLGNADNVPSIAVTFRNASPFADRGPGGPAACWDRITETHEILHTLGAVQLSSPNSDGGGHCRDGQDIMCYGAGLRVRCQSAVAQLDCGSDDYFAINPAPGSYLSTHWNTARSIFLGDALGLDLLPVEIPRP